MALFDRFDVEAFLTKHSLPRTRDLDAETGISNISDFSKAAVLTAATPETGAAPAHGATDRLAAGEGRPATTLAADFSNISNFSRPATPPETGVAPDHGDPGRPAAGALFDRFDVAAVCTARDRSDISNFSNVSKATAPPETGRVRRDGVREGRTVAEVPAPPAVRGDPIGATAEGPVHRSAAVSSPDVLPPIAFINTTTALAAVLPAMLTAASVGLDVETTGLDPRVDRLRLVQVATPEQTFVIDAFAIDVQALRPLFESGPLLILQNGKFDLGFLYQAGLPIPDGDRLFDTMLASQLITAGLESPKGTHSLAGIAERCLDIIVNKTEQTSDWSGSLRQEQVEYAGRDAAVLLPLYEALTAALAAARLTRTAAIEMRALPAIVWLCASGVPISVADWMALAGALTSEKDHLVAQLTALAGRELNWNSAQQVKRLLQERGHTIAGTSRAVLKAIEGADPLVPLLLEYSAQPKLASSHGENYVEQYVDRITGRIYAGFRQIGAASGRMSCSRPNLQGVPRDQRFRGCFRPEPGRVLVKADYSQIEVRIAAFISRDEAMLAAYREGADLHVRTAASVLGISEDEITKDQRQLAKALNFGLLYGMGAARLREYAASNFGVRLTDEDAVLFRKRFFEAYPRLRSWQQRQGNGFAAITSWDDQAASGTKAGAETRTLAGRRRLGVDKYTERLNSPVQGTGADILKLAMARIFEDRAAFPSAAFVLVVHDELVLECDTDDAVGVAAWLKRHMEAAGAEFLTDLPVIADPIVMFDWGNEAAA